MKHLLNDLEDVLSTLRHVEQNNTTAEEWDDLVSEKLLDDIADLCERISSDFTDLQHHFNSVEK
jgi:hypothetical protein